VSIRRSTILTSVFAALTLVPGQTLAVDVQGYGAGTSSPVGALAVGRSSHTTTFLPDGRGLVPGGWGLDGVIASAEAWTTERSSSPTVHRAGRAVRPLTR